MMYVISIFFFTSVWKHVIHIFMQIFMSLYERQLEQQICYSFTLLISFIHSF